MVVFKRNSSGRDRRGREKEKKKRKRKEKKRKKKGEEETKKKDGWGNKVSAGMQRRSQRETERHSRQGMARQGEEARQDRAKAQGRPPLSRHTL